jgi:hypothetical protein
MQSAIHTVGVGFQRAGIVAVLVVFAVILCYALLVFGIVAVQAFQAFGGQ